MIPASKNLIILVRYEVELLCPRNSRQGRKRRSLLMIFKKIIKDSSCEQIQHNSGEIAGSYEHSEVHQCRWNGGSSSAFVGNEWMIKWVWLGVENIVGNLASVLLGWEPLVFNLPKEADYRKQWGKIFHVSSAFSASLLLIFILLLSCFVLFLPNLKVVGRSEEPITLNIRRWWQKSGRRERL